MTVYAPSDHVSITVPDGCGESHLLTDERALTCPVCEPLVLAMKTGWASTPEAVERTPDERAADEQAQKGAARERDRTFADPHALAAVLRDAITPAPPERAPSLLEQIAALGPDDRAALKALLLEADNAATTAESAEQSKAPRLTSAPADDELGVPHPAELETTPVTAVTTQPVVPVKIVKPTTAGTPPAVKPAKQTTPSKE